MQRIPFFLLLLLLVACGPHRQEEQPRQQILAAVKTTPVRDQGNSSLCWVYAMLGTIESEHLQRGDSVCLSPAFLARRIIERQATDYYFSRQQHPITLRGTASMALDALRQDGIIPYDSYPDRPGTNYGVLCQQIEHLADVAAAQGRGLQWFREQMEEQLDETLGALPAPHVYMLGAEYTRGEFARSVCAPHEYKALTSFTHHPFYTSFALEIPDNRYHDTFYNIPLDSLMANINRHLRHGHPVCWEGDISNPYFGQKLFCDIPAKTITQGSRQRAFERLETTDDHAMVIVGIIRHHGHLYYVMKNSWGTEWGRHGFICLSENYLRQNTIAVWENGKK